MWVASIWSSSAGHQWVLFPPLVDLVVHNSTSNYDWSIFHLVAVADVKRKQSSTVSHPLIFGWNTKPLWCLCCDEPFVSITCEEKQTGKARQRYTCRQLFLWLQWLQCAFPGRLSAFYQPNLDWTVIWRLSFIYKHIYIIYIYINPACNSFSKSSWFRCLRHGRPLHTGLGRKIDRPSLRTMCWSYWLNVPWDHGASTCHLRKASATLPPTSVTRLMGSTEDILLARWKTNSQ